MKEEKAMLIRKARPTDALGIHLAHMKSIQEVCSLDHSVDEVSAWGNRPYDEESRVKAITEECVFVVEKENQIQGYAHFHFLIDAEIKSPKEVYIVALYLTKETIGHGIGKKLVEIIIDECKKMNVKKMSLHSTITAHPFYEKLGFLDTAPMTTVVVNHVPVRCTPMEKILTF